MSVSNPVRIVTPYGVNMAMTEDGEVWITETEKENDVWSQYVASFNATTYVILISLLNSLFPHRRQGQPTNRIDGTKLIYAIDLSANTSAILRFGVITRIDGTNADIRYFAGLPFLSGISKDVLVETLNPSPSQVKLDFSNTGALLHGITNSAEANVAAVNTAITLNSPAGIITPGLGDVIMKYEHTSGSANVGAFVLYHTH